jgi:hypothetical protein
MVLNDASRRRLEKAMERDEELTDEDTLRIYSATLLHRNGTVVPPVLGISGRPVYPDADPMVYYETLFVVALAFAFYRVGVGSLS